jgi:F0F1-type ATP synthase assembly protein I
MKSGDERPSKIFEALKTLTAGSEPVSPAAASAYSLIGSIGFLGVLGYAFDRWQGTAPVGVAVGLLLGMVVGMYILAKELWHR